MAIKRNMMAMRYRLRTLLIVLALGPPVLAGFWWFGDAILESHDLWAGAALMLCFAFGLAGIFAWIAKVLIYSASHPDNRE